MKRHMLLIAGVLLAINGFGQVTYEPQILILSPNEVIYAKVFL